jgi:antitoxin (DNA-binding transcriptional repressor) of toxin-antitoxin stability system
VGTSIEEHFVEGIAMFRYQLVELGVREAKDRYSRTLRQVAEGGPDGREVIVVVHRHGRPYAAVIHPGLLKRLVSVLAASEGAQESKIESDPLRPQDPGPPTRPEEVPSSAGETSRSATPEERPPEQHQDPSAGSAGCPREDPIRTRPGSPEESERTTVAGAIEASLSANDPMAPTLERPVS